MSPSKQKPASAKRKARTASKRPKPTGKTKTATPARKPKKVAAAKPVAPPAVGRTTRSVATSRVAGEVNTTIKMARDLAAIVERRSLSELIVETKDTTYTLRRGGPAAPPRGEAVSMAPYLPYNGAEMVGQVSAPAANTAATADAAGAGEPAEGANGEYHLVTSPFVGTHYRRPNPDADSYVEVGQRVEKGQVLCIIEAMKLMNEIESDVAGVIVAALVEDSEPVEYGQPLFKISPL